MDKSMNVVTAPKTATVQMRINPEVKRRLVSPENAEFMKAKTMRRLLDDAQKAWDSAEKVGWLTLDDVSAQLGIEDE